MIQSKNQNLQDPLSQQFILNNLLTIIMYENFVLLKVYCQYHMTAHQSCHNISFPRLISFYKSKLAFDRL